MTLNLEEIEARCEKATPGPWMWEACDASTVALHNGEVMNGLLYCARCKACEERDSRCFWPSTKDSEFIAHARTDVPALCREVRRLRDWKAQAENLDGCLSELKRLQEALETERENRGLDNDTWAAENAALRDWQTRAAPYLEMHMDISNDDAEIEQLLSELEGEK